jgi:hypothetical protein
MVPGMFEMSYEEDPDEICDEPRAKLQLAGETWIVGERRNSAERIRPARGSNSKAFGTRGWGCTASVSQVSPLPCRPRAHEALATWVLALCPVGY